MRSPASGPTEDVDFAELFARRLLVVSGKGGVGKTAVAAGMASLAARAGRNVLLIGSDGRGDIAPYLGRKDAGYRETELEARLWTLTADFDSLLADYVSSAVPIQLVADRILGSVTFRYFTRATPGLPDLLLLGKVRSILMRTRARAGAPKYDLIVLDAPATGHALSLLRVPRTMLKTIPAGPLRKVAHDLDRLLSDPRRAGLVAVAEPAELAAREAEEVVEGALEGAGLATGLVVVNRIGRSGAPESLPRLDLPVVRVPELPPDDGEGDETSVRSFFAAFRSSLAGETRPARGAERRGAVELPPDTLDLHEWLAGTHLLVLTGAGGVGKTTLSAAAGIAAARTGRRVLVLTVDPARRLAQALGIEGRLDEPFDVKVDGLPKGALLRAMQIDPKATFERLLPRIAPPAVVERIRGNRLYSGLVDSLPGVLEYMGVEALAEHARDGDVDLIVLDTPPAARGLDFLSAPDRMVALLENDALRWFLRSDSLLGRAISGASRGAATLLRLADRALGFGFLSDLADFFHAFDGLYDGFRKRSREIGSELKKGRFLVVSSLDRSALETAAETAEALKVRGAEPGLILNRVSATAPRRPKLPPPLRVLPRKSVAESAAAPSDLPVFLARELSR